MIKRGFIISLFLVLFASMFSIFSFSFVSAAVQCAGSPFTGIPELHSVYYIPSHAFDGKYGTTYTDEWYSATDSVANPASIGYDFRAPVLVTEYSIVSVSYAPHYAVNPGSWRFEASNDFSTWIVLDTRTVTSWNKSAAERKSFPIATEKQGNYRYYRLVITNRIDGVAVSSKALSELEFKISGDCPDISGLKKIPTNVSYTFTGIPELHSAYYIPSHAFDGKYGTAFTDEWYSNTDTAANPASIGYDFRAPVLVTEYSIISVSDASHYAENPGSWRFEGSNDFSTWTILDKRNVTGWGYIAERKSFPIATEKQGNYRYYRLVITNRIDGVAVSSKALSELEFYTTSSFPNIKEFPVKLETPSPSSYTFTGIPELHSAYYIPSHAFDGKYGTTYTDEWYSNTDSVANPASIGYDFRAPVLVTEYSIISVSDASHYAVNPGSWRFEGSNDFSTWTILDKRNVTGWGYIAERKSFPIATEKQGNYRYYRLVITNRVDGVAVSSKALSELEFYNTKGFSNVKGFPVKLETPSPSSDSFSNISALSSSYDKSHAFDGKYGTTYTDEWYSATDSVANPASIGYDFRAPVLVTEYSIISVSDASHYAVNPGSWRFEGSNDFSTWTILDTRTVTGWGYIAERKSFPIATEKQGNYRYYRLVITNRVDGVAVSSKALSELEFYNTPLTLSFISPTPANNAVILNPLIVNVSASKALSSCTAKLYNSTGVNVRTNNMAIISDAPYYSTISQYGFDFVSEDTYTYYVTCDGVNTETRTVKITVPFVNSGNVTQANWTNMNGKVITKADLNDTVKLSMGGSNLEGMTINYTVYKQETSSFLWIWSKTKSVAIDSVSTSDLYINKKMDVPGTYIFNISLIGGDGKIKTSLISSTLEVSDRVNNAAPKISVIAPACGENFTLGQTINFNLNLSDEDDVVNGGLYLDNQNIVSITNEETHLPSYTLNDVQIPGNVQIKINVSENISDGRLFSTQNFNNIIVVNTSMDARYLAACIVKPTGGSNWQGNVEFNASTTKALNYTVLSDSLEIINNSNLLFNWTIFKIESSGLVANRNFTGVGLYYRTDNFIMGDYILNLEVKFL